MWGFRWQSECGEQDEVGIAPIPLPNLDDFRELHQLTKLRLHRDLFVSREHVDVFQTLYMINSDWCENLEISGLRIAHLDAWTMNKENSDFSIFRDVTRFR